MTDVKYAMFMTREDMEEKYEMPKFEFEEPMLKKMEKVEETVYNFLTPII